MMLVLIDNARLSGDIVADHLARLGHDVDRVAASEASRRRSSGKQVGS